MKRESMVGGNRSYPFMNSAWSFICQTYNGNALQFQGRDLYKLRWYHVKSRPYRIVIFFERN